MAGARAALSALEHEVMRVIWRRGAATAEEICAALRGGQKNATVRTILRRLEEKGYVSHKQHGRAFVYEATVAPGQAAAGAVRRIIERFCGGSVEALLVGLIDARVVKPGELEALTKRVARAQRARGRRGEGGQ
jgi:predicted transcriptional regulator